MPPVPGSVPSWSTIRWSHSRRTAATPKAIVTQLNQAAVKALRHPDVVRALSSQGAEPAGNSPEAFRAFIKSEIDKWGRMVKASGARLD